MPNEEGNKAGPGQDTSGGEGTDDDDIKALKELRVISKGKFTTKERIFNDPVLQNTSVEVLSDSFF